MKNYVLLLLFIPFMLMAKPIQVVEILTQKNSFRLDTTVAYSNIQSANNMSASQTFQTQNGDFVNLPVYLGIHKSNQDYLNYDFTLRYGFNKDIEIFASVNAYSSKTRSAIFGEFESQSDKGLNALSLGFTYQMKAESDTPALLVGASSQIFDKTNINNETYDNKFKNFRIFATSFYTVDPVVFLLNTSYTFNLEKDLGDIAMNTGDILTISPQIHFSVNPYTAINWGVTYNYFGKTKIDGTTTGSSGSNLFFLTGVSYEFSASTFLIVNAEFLNTNAMTQNTISATLSYMF